MPSCVIKGRMQGVCVCFSLEVSLKHHLKCFHCSCTVSCMHVVVHRGVWVFQVSLWLFTSKWSDSSHTGSDLWLLTACPHFKKFEAPKACAPFSPTAAPELCLTLQTKWRLCVTNWFQLAVAIVSTLEGAFEGRRGGGCVTWPRREMPDVMWCVW